VPAIGFSSKEATCDLCDGAAPERYPVDFGMERAPQACAACRSAFDSGGLTLEPEPPAFVADREVRWVGIRGADLEELAERILDGLGVPADAEARTDVRCADVGLALDRLQRLRPELERAAAAAASEVPPAGQRRATTEALVVALVCAARAGVEVLPRESMDRLRMRADQQGDVGMLLGLHDHWRGSVGLGSASAPPPPSRVQQELLDRARRQYLLAPDPSDTAWGRRWIALRAAVQLEAGRRDEARRLLEDGLRDGAAGADPRLLHLRALLYLQEGHHRPADDKLRAALDELARRPDRAQWRDVELATLHNLYVRAVGRDRWADACGALRAYCRLAPEEVDARFDLAHAYVASSLDPVAREVLGGVLDETATATFRACYEHMQRRAEGVMLYATCLLRLGRAAEGASESRRRHAEEARRVLERHLESAGDSDPRTAEGWGLLAHCCRELGDPESALEAAGRAHALDGSAARGRELWFFAHEALRHCLALDVGPETVVDAIREHVPGLRAAMGDLHAGHLLLYLLHRGESGVHLSTGAAGLELGGSLRSTHYDGSTQLAYTSLVAHNPVQAWQRNHQAVRQGALPIPFRLFGDVRRRYQSWSAQQRELFDRVLLAALEALSGC